MTRDVETWAEQLRPPVENAANHCAECSLRVVVESGPIAAGTLLDGRYRVEELLGEGAMGEVYRARDVHLGRMVAIKRPRALGRVAERVGGVFEREAALLARMRSPNAAPIYAFGTAFGAPFFAMELVEGPTLAALITRRGSPHTTLPIGRSVAILREIASALSEAHALGIVHRDVKPANVIVEHDSGRVVLVDFGVALDAVSAEPGDRVYGTLEYIAPEVLAGGRSSPASDQFALAVVAYELFTGVLPFSATPFELMRPERPTPPRPSSLVPIAAPFDRVVLRALSPDPSARFPTVASFATALRDASATSVRGPASRGDPSGVVDVESGSLRVLVVDDDPVFVRLATRCVQVAFADVPIAISRATSGEQALEKCARGIPQLVLLDYHLTDTDGVELLTRIRDLPEGRSARVVVVTSGADEEAVHRFAALGVRRFARKPLDFEQVVHLIAEVARAAGWLRPTM